MASVRERHGGDGEREDRATALPDRIVFFDGLCGLCDRSVQLLLARDGRQRLHFAPLQGETAGDLRADYPMEFPQGVESLVFCDNTGARPRFYTRSRASFAIAREIESLRGWAWLSVVPRPLSDLAYRALAASRYALFGRLEACRVPRPQDLGRFLD
jgi:predicted DCC family thiol-disulfide oxidoreductase YuxK